MKTQPTQPTQPTILTDTREQCPLEFVTLPSEKATLTTADYSAKGLEDILMIERKSVPDLVSTLFNKTNRPRFEKELVRMLAAPSRHLLIVGDNSHTSPREDIESGSYPSQVKPHQVFASVSSIAAKGISIHWCDDPTEAARLVESLVWYSWRMVLKRAGLTPPPTPQCILKPNGSTTSAT